MNRDKSHLFQPNTEPESFYNTAALAVSPQHSQEQRVLQPPPKATDLLQSADKWILVTVRLIILWPEGSTGTLGFKSKLKRGRAVWHNTGSSSTAMAWTRHTIPKNYQLVGRTVAPLAFNQIMKTLSQDGLHTYTILCCILGPLSTPHYKNKNVRGAWVDQSIKHLP